MPFYEFQCEDCGVRFERLYKSIARADNAAPCPDCGEPSRKLVTAASHSFKHSESQTRGALPPNTGTSDDWNYDKAIGRDAAVRWEAVQKRDAVKDAVIRDERKRGRAVTREHLVPTSESREEFRVITESERKWVNDSRKMAEKAREVIVSPPGE